MQNWQKLKHFEHENDLVAACNWMAKTNKTNRFYSESVKWHSKPEKRVRLRFAYAFSDYANQSKIMLKISCSELRARKSVYSYAQSVL